METGPSASLPIQDLWPRLMRSVNITKKTSCSWWMSEHSRSDTMVAALGEKMMHAHTKSHYYFLTKVHVRWSNSLCVQRCNIGFLLSKAPRWVLESSLSVFHGNRVRKVVGWEKDSFTGKAKAVCTSKENQRILSPVPIGGQFYSHFQ